VAVEICDLIPLVLAFVEADPERDFIVACQVYLAVEDTELVLA